MKKLILCLLVFLSMVIGIQTSHAKVKKVGKNRIIIYSAITIGDEVLLGEIFQENAIVDNWIIEVNSPGGLTYIGLFMYNEIRDQIKKGKHITTVVKGEADSMGGVLFLSGQKRIIYEGSQIMFHKAFQINRAGKKVPLIAGSDEEKQLKIVNDFFVKILKKYYNNDIKKTDDLLGKTLRLSAKEAHQKGMATEYVDLTK